MWLVVVPASYHITKDESERTLIVARIAKAFARITNPTLVVLVLTGIYNASWYLPSVNSAFNSYGGIVLLVKSILVTVLIALIYVHGVYFGRKIVKLAIEKKLDELRALRRKSRIASYANLALMVVILILAAMLQMPP